MVARRRRIKREKKLTRATTYGSKPSLLGGITGGMAGSVVVEDCGLPVGELPPVVTVPVGAVGVSVVSAVYKDEMGEDSVVEVKVDGIVVVTVENSAVCPVDVEAVFGVITVEVSVVDVVTVEVSVVDVVTVEVSVVVVAVEVSVVVVVLEVPVVAVAVEVSVVVVGVVLDSVVNSVVSRVVVSGIFGGHRSATSSGLIFNPLAITMVSIRK